MTYEHIPLFAETQWLVIGMGALLLFYIAGRYIRPKRNMTTPKQESRF